MNINRPDGGHLAVDKPTLERSSVSLLVTSLIIYLCLYLCVFLSSILFFSYFVFFCSF